MRKKTDLLSIQLKSITENDIPFLYQVYRSTRLEELAPANWPKEELEKFLQSQFQMQHKQYMSNYKASSFNIITYNNTPVGRLYINREKNDIRIIDIALLVEYRKKGIASFLFNQLIEESNKNNTRLSLHVEHNNPIMTYYKKIGFKFIEDRGVYHYMEREVTK